MTQQPMKPEDKTAPDDRSPEKNGRGVRPALPVILLSAALAAAIVFGAVMTALFAAGDAALTDAVKENNRLTEALAVEEERSASAQREAEECRALLDGGLDEAKETIDALRGELADLTAEAEARVKALEEQLEALGKVCRGVDLAGQSDILRRLDDLLSSPYPKYTTGSDGTASATDAAVSIYYKDLTSGNTYSFNADAEFLTASAVKAPLIWSFLEEVGSEPSEYDLTEKFVYDRAEDFREGSGIIQNGSDGDEYTYLDLVRLLLEKSDNVALAALQKKYDIDRFLKAEVRKLGLGSMYKTVYRTCAADFGVLMEKIYGFLESGRPYSGQMKEWMEGSDQKNLVCAAASPKPVAHKYGWDTDLYHDAAIVYDEHPYVVVLLTDYNEITPEVNEYLVGVLSLIDELHEGFHPEQTEP